MTARPDGGGQTDNPRRAAAHAATGDRADGKGASAARRSTAEQLAGRLGALEARSLAGERVTLGHLMAAFGRSGFGLVILVLSLPPLIPIPGPFGLVFGTVLSFVAVQMLLARRRPWLPGFLERRTLPQALLSAMVPAALRCLTIAGRWLRPKRMAGLSGRLGQRLSGVPVLILAVIIALPIPFANIAPSLALIVLALALIERDGLMQMMALGFSVVALAVTGAIVLIAGEGLALLLA